MPSLKKSMTLTNIDILRNKVETQQLKVDTANLELFTV